jgi:hypothetical protein
MLTERAMKNLESLNGHNFGALTKNFTLSMTTVILFFNVNETILTVFRELSVIC